MVTNKNEVPHFILKMEIKLKTADKIKMAQAKFQDCW